MKQIVLASASPRRKELLEEMDIAFIVDPSGSEENIDESLSPLEIAATLSLQKAQVVAKRHKNALVIGADTIVVLGKKILGKPKTKAHAKEMLSLLSGKAHDVITGFTIIDTDTGKKVTKAVTTKVYFKKITQEEKDAYVATGEPMDKAGAYAIQERGSFFIEKIEGDFDNVVGLPLFAVKDVLSQFG